MNLDPIVYEDMDPIEVQVFLGKQRKPYILREASEDAHVKYTNALLKTGVKLESGSVLKEPKEGMIDVQSYLVSMCLFEVPLDKKTGEVDPLKQPFPVDLRTIRSWKAPVVKMLYDRVQEISELGKGKAKPAADEAEPPAAGSLALDEQVKNSPSAMTGTSV